MAEYELNACRLLCPLPVIKTQNRVRELAHGDLLEVLATDPGVLNDVPAWARINGHRVLESGRRDGIVFVQLQVVREGA